MFTGDVETVLSSPTANAQPNAQPPHVVVAKKCGRKADDELADTVAWRDGAGDRKADDELADTVAWRDGAGDGKADDELADTVAWRDGAGDNQYPYPSPVYNESVVQFPMSPERRFDDNKENWPVCSYARILSVDVTLQDCCLVRSVCRVIPL